VKLCHCRAHCAPLSPLSPLSPLPPNDAAKEASKAQIKDGFLDDLKAAIAEIDELPIGSVDSTTD